MEKEKDIHHTEKTQEEMVKEAVEEAKKAASEAEAEKPEAEAEEQKSSEEAAEQAEADKEEASEGKKGKLFGKKKKDKKDEKIEELTDRLTRQMAEFDNFRKRTEKEKSQMYEIGAKDIIEKILPVVDNFERGLAAVAEDDKEDPFVQGMDKIYKQLMTTLDGIGVKPIEAVGQEFNLGFPQCSDKRRDCKKKPVRIRSPKNSRRVIYVSDSQRHSMVKG